MALKGTNQEFGRPYNRRIVFETIRLKGPISRAGIARDIELSLQTVSNITKELEEAGLLISARERRDRPGQPATMLAVDPHGGLAIGLQLTQTSLRSVVVNLAGEVINRGSRDLKTVDPDVVFALIRDLVDEIRGERPVRRHIGIGLAMPGPFNVEPMSFSGSTTIEGWRDVPIHALLQQSAGLPAFIGMDAGAAAIGERFYGAGREIRDFFYLYFGAGLGGGMVRDGQLWHGAFGNAGEIGHFPLVGGGEACPCGSRGCLERYLSLDALGRRCKAAGMDPVNCPLDALARQKHPIIETWLAETGPLLARAVVSIENLLDPEAVIIGGHIPPLLLDRLIAAAEPLPPSVSQRSARANPRIVRSQTGADAALLGAAVLAISGVLSPRMGRPFAKEDGSDPIVARAASQAARLPAVGTR
jgi:predicted NBD/HSP70 family sugar kinase